MEAGLPFAISSLALPAQHQPLLLKTHPVLLSLLCLKIPRQQLDSQVFEQQNRCSFCNPGCLSCLSRAPFCQPRPVCPERPVVVRTLVTKVGLQVGLLFLQLADVRSPSAPCLNKWDNFVTRRYGTRQPTSQAGQISGEEAYEGLQQ